MTSPAEPVLKGTPSEGLFGATLGFFVGFAAVALFGPTAVRFREAMDLSPTALGFLIDLPLAYYSDYVRPHAYDLSNQTLGKWLGDGLKGLAVGMVVSALFAWVPFWLLRRSPKRWWLWTAAPVVPGLGRSRLVVLIDGFSPPVSLS